MLASIGIFCCFIVYMIFWLQLPGMLLEDILLPKKLKWSVKLLAGFFFGFAVLAILYYFESLLKIKYVITIAGPVLSILSIIHFVKNGRPKLFNEGEKIRPAFWVIFALLYIMCFLGFQLPYMHATDGITTQIYHDYLFHVGNITSLSRSFPNYDIRVYGVMFYYHYFMELLFAMCKHIFGVKALTLYLVGDAPMTAWTLSLAFVALGDRIQGSKRFNEIKYFIYSIATIISCIGILRFTVRWKPYPVSWLNNHLFTNANAIGLAVALTVVFLDVLVEIWEEKFNIKRVIAIFLLMICCTGFKGTTGILLVGITLSVFVIELLITRKFSIQKLAYAISSIAAFVLTYVTVVAGFNTQGANNRTTTLSIWGTLETCAFSNRMYEELGIDYHNMPWTIIAIILVIIGIMGPMIVTYLIFAVDRLVKLIKTGVIENIYDWFCIGAILMSWIGFVSFSIEGLSQAYLVLASSPLIVYCSLRVVEEYKNIVIRLFVWAILAVGMLTVVAEARYYVREARNQNAIYGATDQNRDDLVNYQVVEGYDWLRENTDEDSLVAVDIHTENLDYRNIYFYCSSISERQCYIEGFDYTDVAQELSDKMMATNDLFYVHDKEIIDSKFEEYGIDYLVVSNKKNPYYESPTDRLSLCFSNSKISIYKFE